MGGKRNHWLAVGLILATGGASIALATYSLAGFTSVGDVMSGSTSHVENLATAMLGTLLLVVLEYVRSTRRSSTGRPSSRAAARA